MFGKTKLSVRLASGYAAVLTVAAVLAYVAFSGVSVLGQAVNVQSTAKELVFREIDHLNWVEKLDRTLRDPSKTSLDVQKDEHLCAFGKWYYSDGRRTAEASIPGITEALAQVEIPHRDLHRSAIQIEEILKTKGHAEAQIHFENVTRPNLQKIRVLLGEIHKASTEHVQAKAGPAVIQKLKTNLLVILAAAFTLGLGIAFFSTKSISSLLARIASRLSQTGTEVEAASSQLSGASAQVAESATQAAASLEETVASIHELSSMVKANAENAKTASQLSVESDHAARDGEAEISRLMESMNQITQSSKKIEEIINVIDDIAFQTNLLALNAAVEAARAGEQGKGFAVVAEAVRALAQRSGSAAKDIAALIKESVQQIEQGKQVADSSGRMLNGIVGSVKKVSALNGEIAAASSEQATGINQISSAMNDLDGSTQRNAAASEELTASAQELTTQATALHEMLEELTGLIYGSSARSMQGLTAPITEAAGEAPRAAVGKAA